MKCKSLRTAAALVLALVMTFPSVFASPAGEQTWQVQDTLADGVTYLDTVSLHSSYGREELYSLRLTPGGAVKPIVLTGDSTIYGGATINGVIARAQSLGYHVLGAVNADFFSMSTRVPMGLVIEDGIYKSSSEEDTAIAFRSDGSVFLADANITLTLTNQGGSQQANNAGQTVSLSCLNKTRSDNGLYLYNEYFSTVSTRTTSAGWMVRLKVVEGALTLNSAVTLEVEDVFLTDGDQIPHAQTIGEGYYILTAAQVSGLEAEFSKFAVGDKIILSAVCQDEALKQASWACGGGDVLVQSGQLTDSSSWDTSISSSRHPRTLLGIHADGSLQLTVVDGRKSAHSNGLSLSIAAQELLEQGCVTVINLDGGGSSAMAVQLPGNTEPTVVNSPSDGSLRRCGTYILLVSEAQSTGTPAQLHLAQNGAVVFQGSSLDLSQVFATDAAAYATEVPGDVTLSVSGTHGTLSGTTYTASSPGVETVTLTSPSTGAAGTAQIYVVDSLTALSVTRDGESTPITSLALEGGDSVQLNVSALWNGLPVTIQSLQANWSVTGNIGSITPDGLFTASYFSGASGTVDVSCGGLTQSLSLNLPIDFLDVDDSWAKDFIMNLAQQGIVGGVNTQEGTMYYPNNSVTRQEFFIMLCNLLKVNPTDYADTQLPFADAEQIPSWSLNYIKAMYALGYTGGSLGSDGLLYSNFSSQITRAEIAVLLAQFLTPAEEFTPPVYADQDQIPGWAVNGILNAVSNGLLGGYPDGSIQAANSATRAEVAVILCNFQPLLEAAQAASPDETEETPSANPDISAQSGNETQ